MGRVPISLSNVTFDTGNTTGKSGDFIVIYTSSVNNSNKYMDYTDCLDKTQSANPKSDSFFSQGNYVIRDKLHQARLPVRRYPPPQAKEKAQKDERGPAHVSRASLLFRRRKV